MKVIRTKDINVIKYISPFIDQFINDSEISEYDLQIFLLWYTRSIENPGVATFLYVDEENNCFGYAIISIIGAMRERLVNIMQIFCEQEEGYDEILKSIEQFAKDNAIHKLTTITKFPKVWKKERGFEVTNHIVTKEV